METNSDKKESLGIAACFQKDKMETALYFFKLLYYTAITGGILWHLLYFFTVGVLPDLDIANLIGYLISIFVIGLFITFLFVLSFIFPGLLVRFYSKGKGESEVFLNEWLHYEVDFIRLPLKIGQMIFLVSAFATIISFGILVIGYKLSFLRSDMKSPFWLSIVIPMLTAIIYTVRKIPKRIFESTEKRKYLLAIVGAIISAVFFIILSPLFILPLAKLETWFGLFTFGSGLLIAAIMNGLIATEGFTFINEIKTPALKVVFGFLFVSVFTCLFFSVASDKSNPLVTVPFRSLRIGEIDANISLDEDYVKKSQLREKGYFPENCQTTFRFKILSSIGTEYIVQYPSDLKTDKNVRDYPSESKTATKKGILRIPKSKVLLVEYEKTQ